MADRTLSHALRWHVSLPRYSHRSHCPQVAAALEACADAHGEWVLDVLPPTHVLLSAGQLSKGPGLLALARVVVPPGGPSSATPVAIAARATGCYGDGDKVLELGYR
jgi:hypothetical protein